MGQSIKGPLVLLGAILLVVFHIFLCKGPIKTYAPTYDEPLHLTAGFSVLKAGEYRLNGYHHPPFGELWAALPLLWLNPILPKQHNSWLMQKWDPLSQYQFADSFLYKNRVDADQMMQAGRWMQVVLSIFLGMLIGVVAWKTSGVWASLFAVLFWATSPSILANATVVSTDLAFTAFAFAFFVSFLWRGSVLAMCASGVALAFCLASKYFSIAVLPIAFVVMIFEKDTWKNRLSWKKLLAFVMGGIVVLIVIYQGTDFGMLSQGIINIFGRSQAGRSSFFWGDHGNQGWWLYFPVNFLLKTQIPILIALVAVILMVVIKKMTIPLWLWGPPLLFFLLACMSKVQIGHRYILFVYPFVFVLCGMALAGSPLMRIIGGILSLWLIVIVLSVRPHFLPYFNELIGGSKNGFRYFTDSNVDWGQGLKMLSGELLQSDLANGIYLSYFGVANPHYYGLKYWDVGSDTIAGHIDNSFENTLRPTKFAISVTNFQSTYYSQKDVFAWLNQYKPWKVIGHSIFVYDFKDEPDALRRLSELRTGNE